MELNLPIATSPSYFLGSSTPNGFFSLYEELYAPLKGWQITLIKGGPGTGKSSVMKKLANEADKRGVYCERIYCSSDPKSLDAVIFPSLKRSICDATPPHTLEARFPGVCETVLDLGAFRNDERLQLNREKIMEKYMEYSEEHRKCRSFLCAANAFWQDNRLYASACLQTDKLEHFTQKLCEKELCISSSQEGQVRKRFISAVTPQGIKTFYDSIKSMCERVIVLEDTLSVASNVMLRDIAQRASAAGLDVTQCVHPFHPSSRLQGVMIDELSLGFFADDGVFRMPFKPDKTVHCARFYDNEKLSAHKYLMRFNQKIRDVMIKQATESLLSAKKIHDELECFYIEAMDFKRVEKKAEELKKSFFG